MFSLAVVWHDTTATVARERMKPILGRFPYELEGNCRYAVGSVMDYPIALVPYRKTTPREEVIPLGYYANDLAIDQYNLRDSMWRGYVDTYGTLPLLPRTILPLWKRILYRCREGRWRAKLPPLQKTRARAPAWTHRPR